MRSELMALAGFTASLLLIAGLGGYWLVLLRRERLAEACCRACMAGDGSRIGCQPAVCRRCVVAERGGRVIPIAVAGGAR